MRLFGFFFIIFTYLSSFAQFDPSSALLLDPSEEPQSRLESGRYDVRAEDQPKNKEESPSTEMRVQQRQSVQSKVRTEKASVGKNEEVKKGELAPDDNKQNQQTYPQSQNQDDVLESPSGESQTVTFSDQIENVIWGTDDESFWQAWNTLHIEDVRRNLFTLSAYPILVHNDSSSPYWYRQYSYMSAGLGIRSNLWLSPIFGFHLNYAGTSNASLQDDKLGLGNMIANHQWMDMGIRFRKFFGLSRKSPEISFGVDWNEYQFLIEQKDAKNKFTKAGPTLNAQIKIPSSARTSWIHKGAYSPWIGDLEANRYETGSGSSSQTTFLNYSIGQEYILSRHHQIFWNLKFQYEKTQYSGESVIADPVSGVTYAKVPIVSTFTILEFGYTWGN